MCQLLKLYNVKKYLLLKLVNISSKPTPASSFFSINPEKLSLIFKLVGLGASTSEIKTVTLTDYPVSYTHLDVYKRQRQESYPQDYIAMSEY